jgi:hypothetical protein
MVRKEKCPSRKRGEGLGLGLKRVRKNKMTIGRKSLHSFMTDLPQVCCLMLHMSPTTIFTCYGNLIPAIVTSSLLSSTCILKLYSHVQPHTSANLRD